MGITANCLINTNVLLAPSLSNNDTMLRIRDNATVKKIPTPAVIRRELERVQKSSGDMYHTKDAKMKRLLRGSLCCCCGGIPDLEVIYELEGASKIERYCKVCIKKVYEREQVL